MLQFGRGDHGRLGDGQRVTTGFPLVVAINLPPPAVKVPDRNGDSEINGDGLHEVSAPGQESSVCWRVKLVACGGQHTLAVAAWEGAPKIKSSMV